jgi:hypothetical protein
LIRTVHIAFLLHCTMKLVLALSFASASAFVPAAHHAARTSLRSADPEAVEPAAEPSGYTLEPTPTAAQLAGERDEAEDMAFKYPPLPTMSSNGWVPDSEKFCYGLPGSLMPMGEFDPLGFASAPFNDVKLYREAEVQHGRVAMVRTTPQPHQASPHQPPPLSAVSPPALLFSGTPPTNPAWCRPARVRRLPRRRGGAVGAFGARERPARAAACAARRGDGRGDRLHRVGAREHRVGRAVERRVEDP